MRTKRKNSFIDRVINYSVLITAMLVIIFIMASIDMYTSDISK